MIHTRRWAVLCCLVVGMGCGATARAQEAPKEDKPQETGTPPGTSADDVLREFQREQGRRAPGQAPTLDTPDPLPAGGANAALNRPAVDEDTDKPSAPVSAEDVLREFQRERPKPVPLLPSPLGDDSVVRVGDADASDRPRGQLRMPDGYFLVDRAGRVTQDGGWWVFRFVADNNPDESPDAPLRLLPNQMLERMVRESRGGTRSVEFVVSGEVTDFMGQNYLLLRKLLLRRNSSNLRK